MRPFFLLIFSVLFAPNAHAETVSCQAKILAKGGSAPMTKGFAAPVGQIADLVWRGVRFRGMPQLTHGMKTIEVRIIKGATDVFANGALGTVLQLGLDPSTENCYRLVCTLED